MKVLKPPMKAPELRNLLNNPKGVALKSKRTAAIPPLKKMPPQVTLPMIYNDYKDWHFTYKLDGDFQQTDVHTEFCEVQSLSLKESPITEEMLLQLGLCATSDIDHIMVVRFECAHEETHKGSKPC